jgi:hypothetical protein
MTTEVHTSSDTNYLDTVSSQSYKRTVIQAAQVAKAMAQRAKADVDRLRAIDKEQASIRAAYLRYKDLDDEKKNKAERLRRTASVIPREQIKFAAGDEEPDEFDSYMVKVSDLALWEAMYAILEETGEIQLYELHYVLGQFGKKVTRRAIENAITAHAGEFRAVSKGRERFVSLKR